MNFWYELFKKLAGFFSPFFSSKYNPLYHLADVAIFMFAIATLSGIYIFLFYNVDPAHSYHSVEVISSQWVGGVMRSIHRYSSDLLVVFILLHFLHMLITGKFKRVISWISGVASFLVVILIGVTGYVLVWDERAKMIGILIAKFLTAVPVFDPSITGAFLLNDLPSIGGFFRVALFGHIFFTLFTLIIIWIHVLPVSAPRLVPPKLAMIYMFSTLILICLLFPAQSDPPAQQIIFPVHTTFDWFFCFGFVFMKLLSPINNWILMFGSGIVLSIFPYLFRSSKEVPKPVVDLDTCDGCNQCVVDCPYGALDLLPMMDQTYKGAKKAILSPSKCVGCSICAGSCHVDAIRIASVPEVPMGESAFSKKTMAVYHCHFNEPTLPASLDASVYAVPCVGGIHPKSIRAQLENNVEGVAIVACEDCHFRFGKDFEQLRLNRKRRPTLFRRTPLQRIRFISKTDGVENELAKFAADLQLVDDSKVYNKLPVIEHAKQRPVVAALVTLMFFVWVPFFSNATFQFYDPSEKILVLDFRYVSAPTSFLEQRDVPAHMRSTTPIVKTRSPILVTVKDEKGQIIFEKEYKPRGVRQDIAIFVYEEIKTDSEKVDIEIRETERPELVTALHDVQVNESNGTLIVYREGQLKKLE